MVAFILPANSATGGFDIDNSLRFNDGDSAYLSKTFGSAGNRRTYTISTWVKRSNLSTTQGIFCAKQTKDDTTALVFETADTLLFTDRPSDNRNIDLRTNRLFRDPSAWYHLVIAVDTTQGTDSNRVKIYVNGVQETSFSTSSYPSENYETAYWNNTNEHRIGMFQDNSALHYDGYASDFYFIDGSALAPTSFGETNDNGVWVPIEYTGSYGTNGFYLEFQQTGTSADASGKGADTSGNDNHFDDANATAQDITTDTPTNNFATLNPLSSRNATFSEGNVEGIRTSSGSSFSAVSTIAPSNGKWYFEYENTGAQNSQVAIVNLDVWPSGTDLYNFPVGESAAVAIESNANYNITFGQDASNGTTLQNSTDLVTAKYGFAVDIDNNDLYLSANGNWYTGSAFDNTDFSNATAVTTDLPSNAPLAFAANGSLANTFYINFGNPGGDDSITSGNADANGYGNFEYAVPSGYYALCTKNLAEFG